MHFFEKFFELKGKSPLDNGEYAVLCPFEHKDHLGNVYKEVHPSAHINPEKSVFHCKSCRKGMSEALFLSHFEGISYKESLMLLGKMENAAKPDWNKYVQALQASSTMVLVHQLGLEDMVEPLQLGFSGEGIDFPVFMYGELMNVRNYCPTRTPKIKGRFGSKNLIIPFDIWRADERPTLLCAGEKDMAIARKNGFNAITFTGGEQSFPKLFKHSFKGKKIYIAYDNDDAGKEGAKKAAYFLREAGATPYIVTGHLTTCINKGEDIWDFFMKYGKTATDLQLILDTTFEASLEETESAKSEVFPKIPIAKSSEGQYVGKRFVRSDITVLSIYEEMFTVPEYVKFEKMIDDEKSDLRPGDTVEWVLEDDNIGDILYLMDGKVTEASKDKALRTFCNIDPKEEGIRMSTLSQTNVWKSIITDVLDTSDTSNKPAELTVYSIKERLFAGKKYEIMYKPVAHPTDGRKVVGMVKALDESDAEISRFQVTDAVKEELKVFQLEFGQPVEEKMDELFQRSKGFVGVESRKEVTWATDLFFHTPLEFSIGKRTERGYLDVMIVGDPRTMKSQTAKEMRKMYELGTITSLKTATKAGLVGGSDKVAGGGYKTRVGLLPQSHKGALIMEEFSGGGRDIISNLTEVRSSNRVRILRVNGQTDVPAMVRMLSISNPVVGGGGISRALNQYPSGVKVLLDLIGASEDIARYDFFLLVEAAEQYTSPLDMFDLEPYEKSAYMNRIRWVWSRSAEQVQLTRPVAQYIVDKSTALNKAYDCHIKLFGAEAWKKLTRIAIATAGLVVSTDETFENLIVKEEHVDFAYNFMISLYDNDVFKLKGYVQNERAYNECRDVDISALQLLYNRFEAVLREMEISTDMTQRQLQAVSGLKQDDFGALIATLGASKFVQWQGERIVPTGKFRKAMQHMKPSATFLRTASEL